MDDEDGFSTTPATRDNPLLSLARGNVALLIPIVGALIFAFRCVAVARGDILTAGILIAETTVGDAIRALAFLIVELGLLLNAYVLIMVMGRRAKLDRTSAELAAASLVSLITAGYLRGRLSWIDLIPYLLVININLVRLLRRARGYPSDHSGPRALIFYMLFAAAILFASFWILDDTFWLPRERLVFQNEAPFTGYVLKESGDYLVILKDKPRVIIERKKDTLDDRDFCHPRPTDVEQVSEKVQSNTPVCP